MLGFPCHLKSKNYFATSRRFKNILIAFACICILLWISPFHKYIRKEVDTTIPLAQDFQRIGAGPDKLYVYSAYFDEYRGVRHGSIRVLGGIRLNFPRPLYCLLYDENGHHYSTIEANISAITEHWYFRYAATFIICNLYDYYRMPVFVSVVESLRKDVEIANILRIKYPDNTIEKYNFSMCVQPTFDYEDPLQFVEWMEFHRLMGVQKFTFYNKSIGTRTSCLMKSYGDEVEVLPWSSPYEPEKEIRVHSQFIGANDCIYRYRGVTRYLVIVDLDEMIVPLAGNNYNDLFQFLEYQVKVERNFTGHISSFNFRNGFFFTGWEDDAGAPFMETGINPSADAILKQLHISRKTFRTKDLNPNGDRSKFVAIPENVVEVGAHAVYEASGNAFTIDVPEEWAYSHHYRQCLWDYCDTKEKIMETSAHRFANKVALRVADRLNSKAKNCNIQFTD